tara:strand:- start:61 stop:897 length:837 start_codon:yes stop_codon:yes gene_type:complete
MKKLILLLFIPLVSFGQQRTFCDGYRDGVREAERLYCGYSGISGCGTSPSVAGKNYSLGYSVGFADVKASCERQEKEREEKRKNNSSSNITSAQIDWNEEPRKPIKVYGGIDIDENEKFLKSIGWPGYEEEEEEEEEEIAEIRTIYINNSEEVNDLKNEIIKLRSENIKLKNDIKKINNKVNSNMTMDVLGGVSVNSMNKMLNDNKKINALGGVSINEINTLFSDVKKLNDDSLYIDTVDFKETIDKLKKLKEQISKGIITKESYNYKIDELKKILLD